MKYDDFQGQQAWNMMTKWWHLHEENNGGVVSSSRPAMENLFGGGREVATFNEKTAIFGLVGSWVLNKKAPWNWMNFWSPTPLRSSDYMSVKIWPPTPPICQDCPRLGGQSWYFWVLRLFFSSREGFGLTTMWSMAGHTSQMNFVFFCRCVSCLWWIFWQLTIKAHGDISDIFGLWFKASDDLDKFWGWKFWHQNRHSFKLTAHSKTDR